MPEQGFEPQRVGEIDALVSTRTLPAPDKEGVVEVVLVRAIGLLEPRPPAWLRLSADDLVRVTRSQRADDVRRFLTGRAVIDQYLVGVLGYDIGVRRLCRRVDAVGEWKPRLSPSAADHRPLPDVSISHSGEHVIVGFCASADVGVDVEVHTSFATVDDAALAVALTPAERAGVRDVADAAAAFTAKEAVLKAIGWGFAVDPLVLEIIDGEIVRFDSPHARATRIGSVAMPAGVTASVAVTAPIAGD